MSSWLGPICWSVPRIAVLFALSLWQPSRVFVKSWLRWTQGVLFSAICTVTVHSKVQLPSCLVPEIQFVLVSYTVQHWIKLFWNVLITAQQSHIEASCPSCSFFSRCCNVSWQCGQSSTYLQCKYRLFLKRKSTLCFCLVRLFYDTLSLVPSHVC